MNYGMKENGFPQLRKYYFLNFMNLNQNCENFKQKQD